MPVASLEEAGFAVLAAGSGAEALALLDADEPVDVLVSDLSHSALAFRLTSHHTSHQSRPGSSERHNDNPTAAPAQRRPAR